MEKYIISGGCSYFHKSISTIMDILGYSFHNTEVVNIDCPAGSNKYISESIVLCVDSLLKSGISNENIIVINNFTQIGRFSPIVPNEIKNEVETNLKPTEKRQIKDFKYTFYNSFVQVQDRMYSLMIGNDGLSSTAKDWYNEQEYNIETQKRFENNFEEYLENILILQTYLKSNNIKNLSFLMNNVFDGWKYDFSHVYNTVNKWELPSTNNTLHISNISSFAKSLWDMIDLDSFVFYETKDNKYGGIDEYFINKFGDTSYLEDTPQHPHQFYSNHPNEDVYKSFTNDLMKSKIEKWKQNI